MADGSGKRSVTAEDVGKEAANVVSSFSKFKNAIEIGKDGSKSDLTKVVKLLSGSSLSKLSAGMGSVAAVIGFVSLFTSSKSTEELILDMLGNIDSKIDSLQSLMLGRFDRLESVVEQVGANTVLSLALGKIDSVIGSLNVLIQAKDNGAREKAVGTLRKIDSNSLRDAVAVINRTITEGPVSNNVYNANLKTSYGDAIVIQDIGTTLNYYLMSAQMSANVIDILEEIPDEDLFAIKLSGEASSPLDQIPDAYVAPVEYVVQNNDGYFVGYIEKHAEKWSDSLSKVVDERADFIDNYLNDMVLYDLDAKKHKSAAETLVKKLSEKWWWLDHFAVVYDDTSGFTNHVMQGGDYHSYFRHNIKGGKANIVVAWTDDTYAAKGSTRNSNVSHDYFYRRATPGGGVRVVTDTYNGPAEKYDWGNTDLREALDDLVDNKAVTKKRLIWMCKKKKGVSRAQSNDKRLLWIDGKYLDFAVFE